MSAYSEIQTEIEAFKSSVETSYIYPYLSDNAWDLGKTAKALGCSKQALRGAIARCPQLAAGMARHGKGRGRPRKPVK